MRLLVADDESIVAESIERIIAREGIAGIELRVASSGRAAIETAMEFAPQAVFMDINMPGISGLDAMEEICGFLPSARFVILTAYDIFEYARKSVHPNVYEYVLKPFSPSKIASLIRELKDATLKDENEYRSVIAMKEELAIIRSIACDAQLQCMITGSEPAFPLDITAPTEPGSIALVRAEKESYRALVEKVVSQAELKFTGVMVGNFHGGTLAMYIPADAEGFADIIKEKTKSEGISFSMGSKQELNHIWRSYREAAMALRPFDAKDGSCSLSAAAKTLAECAFDDAIADTAVYSVLNDDPSKGLQDATALWMLISGMLAEGERDEVYKEYRLLFNAKSTRDLCYMIKTMTRALLNSRQLLREKPTNRYVFTAAMEIEENYAKNISLESIAEKLHISPGSLSRIFKENCGETLMEALTQKRINRAKELIIEGAQIKQICYMVGYNDPNYFSRAFKKSTGLTPTEFKNAGGKQI